MCHRNPFVSVLTLHESPNIALSFCLIDAFSSYQLLITSFGKKISVQRLMRSCFLVSNSTVATGWSLGTKHAYLCGIKK